MEKIKCDVCGKEYSKMGIGTHIWRAHGAGSGWTENNAGYANGTRTVWNKRLTKENHSSLERAGKTFSDRLNEGKFIHPWRGRTHSDEAKQKMSIARSKNNRGGRCKWYEFIRSNGNIVKVQGTWEFRFASVLDKLDPAWIRPTKDFFEWIDDAGNLHRYTPDFYSPKLDRYFEVKGYWWGNDKRKMELVLEQNDLDIEIVRKKDLEQYEKFAAMV